jgi:hypothetical protein
MGIVSSTSALWHSNPLTPAPGLLRSPSRRPPLRIPCTRRGFVMAQSLQGPDPHLFARRPHGKLRPGIYSLL